MTAPPLAKRVCQVLILAALAAVAIRIFIIDSFTVQGDSMTPGIMSGDYIFVDKRAYLSKEPARGDIVVTKFRGMEEVRAIKRVIAVPPEWVTITPAAVFVQDGREATTTLIDDSSYIALPGYGVNGATTTYRLDPFEYFVLGDNRAVSEDSRQFGPVDTYALSGRVIARFRISDLSLVFY